MQGPIGVRDGGGLGQGTLGQVGLCLGAMRLPDALADKGGIDAGIDHQMGDMDVFGPSSRAIAWAIMRRPALALAKAA